MANSFVLIIIAALVALMGAMVGLLVKLKKFPSWALKAAALVLALFFTLRFMGGQEAISEMFRLSSSVFETKLTNFCALMLVWLVFSSNVVLILYPFFNISYLKWVVLLFCLPVSLFGLVFLPFHATAILGQSAQLEKRLIFLMLESGMAFGLSVGFVLNSSFKKSKEVSPKPIETIRGNFFEKLGDFLKTFFVKVWPIIFIVIAIVFSAIPPYAIAGLFGKNDAPMIVKEFSLLHRTVLYIGFILPFVIHFSLRNSSFEERKFALLVICMGTLLGFSSTRRFDSFLNPSSWPLHLCNTAMYLMPLVLIFNMKRLFYFTYFINVAGAFFAMLMPNYSSTINMFAPSLVLFYINHFIAFFMPILFVSLGMFKRAKFKQFVYSMVGFLAYFVLVLALNAIFTGLNEAGFDYRSTDFFFVNSDFIADKLGQWARNLRNVKWVFDVGKIKLTFYPVYQTLFFLVYIAIGLAMWFIFENGFMISERFADIRQKEAKIRLDKLILKQTLNGRSLTEPMNPQNKNQLILKNFSKKYASSADFAVKDANLTVNGGEIFGFLGPNGAGKSTIIKSIVGMQPITSGSIEVCGFDCEKQSEQAKRQIGFVPDHYALYEKLTGREYINYIADLYNVNEADRTERINNMLARFELTHAFDNQMKTYSHGMKQKIAIMSALVHEPKVWILDEPLTGLDPSSIFQVKECMKEHAKKGNIVFFSSHIIDVVERICDKIAIIKKGEIKLVTSLDEIEKSGQTLESFYMQTIGQAEDGAASTQEKKAENLNPRRKASVKTLKKEANNKAEKKAESNEQAKRAKKFVPKNDD